MGETSGDTRPDLPEYLMSIAVEVATRTNCRRTPVGALIVRDTRIISTGYNGTIPGYTNCLAGGCPRCSDPTAESGKALAICICVHAEQNALMTAARFGVAVDRAECWVTNEPCLECTKSLIQSGIERVVYLRSYGAPGDASHRLREEMRNHAKGSSAIVFEPWSTGTDVLGVEARYDAIAARILGNRPDG